MAVFFNGRLWVSPAVMSVVDDSRMYNKNLSVGNVLAIIGRSEGGEPMKALRFGAPGEARDVLRSGELLTACEKAFDASAQTVGPATIVCIRVNPAVQSALTLKNTGAADAVLLKSTDFGRYTNGIKVKVEAGSEKGKKVSTQLGNAYYTADNIFRDALSVQYVGAELTATITVSGTDVVLAAPAGTTVATLSLTDYGSVRQLVDAINAVPDFEADVLDGNDEKDTLQALDFVSAQDVKTAAYTVTAHLQAVVDWFNGQSEGYVTAERLPNVGAALANINWTYLAGGEDGVVTNTEWQAAFDALQAEDVQWVVPLSSSDALHAMADTHCAYMSNVARMERRCFVGTASGTSDDAAILAAKALNSDRTSLVHMGFYDYDTRGRLVLFEPYFLSAMIAGGFSGVNPGTTLTNKTLKVRGWERKLRNPTDTDRLINHGVLPVEETNRGYKVTKAITTWLVNDNYNRVEVSVGAACDFVSRNVRDVLEQFIGEKGTPQNLTLAVERVDTVLRELSRPEPMGPGVLVGDDENPPYKNIVAEIEGDVMRVEFQASPVIPINYVPIVIHAVPWSGRVTL